MFQNKITAIQIILFPAENADFPHHSEMYNYVKSYADKHKLFENIRFNTKVVHLEGDQQVKQHLNSIKIHNYNEIF